MLTQNEKTTRRKLARQAQRKRKLAGRGNPMPEKIFRDLERVWHRELAKYFEPAAKIARAAKLSGATLQQTEQEMNALLQEAIEKILYGTEEELFDIAKRVSGYTKRRFEAMIKRTMGIDAISVLAPVMEDEACRRMVEENINLLVDKCRDYMAEIYQAVVEDYSGVGHPDGSESLAERLQNITGQSYEHAKFVARDQTSKLNGVLSQKRQESAGITHYVWRTARDQRVVGNPAGKYPVAGDITKHGNHWEREGKVFAWDAPPPDGHPGHAINCRCYADPILDPAKIKVRQG